VGNHTRKSVIVPEVRLVRGKVHQHINDAVGSKRVSNIESLLVVQVQSASVLLEVSTVDTLFLASKSRAIVQLIFLVRKTNSNPLSDRLNLNSKMVVGG